MSFAQDWWSLKMSVNYFQQQPTAMWNPARGVWETTQVNLLCGHSEPYLETWQTSGIQRDGQVFELPMQVHPIPVSESLLSPIPEESMLRTPSAIEGEGGAIREDVARAKKRMVQVRDQMAQLAADNGLKVSASLLPTPNTMDGLPAREGEAYELNLRRGDPNGSRREMSGNLREVVVHDLLPTVTAQDGKYTGGPSQFNRNTKPLNTQVLVGTEWGKFEPAIRRWESVLGRPAPAPTKPDGKDGTHRLSSKFTEWMMGLPDGWVTDVGLTRNEELKLCGNGVVSQQAELALRHLLEGVPLPDGGGLVHLPTPTVSDTFTGNLASTQQTEGSMHSVTLPQAVRSIGVSA